MNERLSFREEQVQAFRAAAEKLSERLSYAFSFDQEKLREFETGRREPDRTRETGAVTAA